MAENEPPDQPVAADAPRIREEFKDASAETLRVVATRQAEKIEMLEAWNISLGRKNEQLGERDTRFRAREEKLLLDIKLLEDMLEQRQVAHAQEIAKLTTDHKEEKKQLALLNTIDGPTGWINKANAGRTLSELARTAKREDKVIALFMFDLDHFKSVNDTYGHDVGDAVIKRVTELIKDCVRPADMTARVGGEEFMVGCAVPKDKAAEVIAHIARDMCTKVFEGVSITRDGKVLANGDGDRKISISIGATAFELPGNGKSRPDQGAIDGVITKATKLADNAAYLAKHNGRNRAHFAAWDYQSGISASEVLYPVSEALAPQKGNTPPNPQKVPT